MVDYEAISKAVSNAVKIEVDKQIKAAYKRGYQKGYSEEYEARQSAVDIAYKRGLNDAWKCARKLAEYNDETFREVIGDKYLYWGTVFTNETASEAIAKIKEYEEKQTEKNCENCECFGDITECTKRPCYAHSCWTPKQVEIQCNATDKDIAGSFIEDVSAVKDQLPYYRNNKYYNTFPTSDEIKAEYDEETRSYIYTVEGKKE